MENLGNCVSLDEMGSDELVLLAHVELLLLTLFRPNYPLEAVCVDVFQLNGFLVFFLSSRRRHTRWPRDWSSDVCSSDLPFFIKKGTVSFLQFSYSKNKNYASLPPSSSSEYVGGVTRLINNAKIKAKNATNVEIKKAKLIPSSIAKYANSFAVVDGSTVPINSFPAEADRLVITVSKTAEPIAPDTCCNVLFIAVPCGLEIIGN